MANVFKNFFSKDVGASASTVYTAPSATQSTVIGFSAANTTNSPVLVDAYITAGGVDYYLVKGATVPNGGALVIVGGDQKVVLEATDAVKIVSSAATSIDAVLSVLEIS